MRRAAHGSMQAESFQIGAQLLLELRRHWHGTLQGQHLLAGTRDVRDSLSTGACLQTLKRARLIRIALVTGQVRFALLFDQYALSRGNLSSLSLSSANTERRWLVAFRIAQAR